MINAAVAVPFEAIVQNATTGLVGQITVEIYDPTDGTQILAPTTAGITETHTGTYRVLLTVATAGTFLIRWTEPSTSYAEEDLTVAQTLAGGPNPFISTQDLVDYLGRGSTTDPGMLIAIDAACDICRTTAEQTFNQTIAGTATLDGTGTDALILPKLPVSAVRTVTIAGGTVTDYVLRDDGVLIRTGNSPTTSSAWDGPWWPMTPGVWPDTPTLATVFAWPTGRQNITVIYDHGYADADLPRDVRMVALSIAARLVVQGPAKQQSIGQVSVTYAAAATDLTNGEKAILRKYKKAR